MTRFSGRGSEQCFPPFLVDEVGVLVCLLGAVGEVGAAECVGAEGVGAKTSFNSSFRRPKSAGMTKNRGRK